MKSQELELAGSAINRSTLEDWMDVVIAELKRGIADGESPFAAGVFSLCGNVIATARNTVATTYKPSRHGEVNAIDQASVTLGKPDLRGHILVSSGEPCPMCTATAAIAEVDAIVFGASAETIRQAGYETLNSRCECLIGQFARDIPVIGGIRQGICDRLLIENAK
jgi:tRNA(Arg) A34 adenosine deaminase TadA